MIPWEKLCQPRRSQGWQCLFLRVTIWSITLSTICYLYSDCLLLFLDIYFLICLIYLLILICLLGHSTVSNTLNVKEILKIYLIEQNIYIMYPNHQEEWYTYHSDLSLYVSVCTVSVWLRRVIHLSQWFITLCLCLYCISMTKNSDTPITVIYHSMSLSVLYQYY